MSRGGQYEIALFGDQESGHIQEIAEALDPEYRIISGRLGRESTIMKNGAYIKDFSYLGRNIKDVIYIDYSDEAAPMHKDNTIIIPKWEGDANDRELIDLVPFLESIAQKPCDVREELRRYGRENTAQKFNSLQSYRRELIMKQQNQGVGGFLSGINKLSQDNKSPKFGN